MIVFRPNEKKNTEWRNIKDNRKAYFLNVSRENGPGYVVEAALPSS